MAAQSRPDRSAPGVYADLEQLARLEHKASGYSFLPRQPVHSLLSGRHAARVRGRGLNFEELRRYLPGDDVRTIDWRVTQRTGKPHVRVFSEERDRPALLVIDQRINMFFGTRVATKSALAAELAALGAWRVFSVGDRPGGLVFNDSRVVEVRPHRSRQRVMRLLGAVVELNHELHAELEVEPSPEMLNRVLAQAARLAGHDWLVAVVSDFHGADGDTRRLLTRLAVHNDVLAALVYDPIKTELAEAGTLVLSDGRLQLELDTHSGRTRRQLVEYFGRDLRETEQQLRKLGVPVLLLSTAEDPAIQLRRLLGYAPRVGAR